VARGRRLSRRRKPWSLWGRTEGKRRVKPVWVSGWPHSWAAPNNLRLAIAPRDSDPADRHVSVCGSPRAIAGRLSGRLPRRLLRATEVGERTAICRSPLLAAWPRSRQPARSPLPASPFSRPVLSVGAGHPQWYKSPALQPPPTAWSPARRWFLGARSRSSAASFPAWCPLLGRKRRALVWAVSPQPGRRYTVSRLSALAAAGASRENWAAGGNCSFCHSQDGGSVFRCSGGESLQLILALPAVAGQLAS